MTLVPRFEFATATRIIFGAGTIAEAAPLARQFGTSVLLVTGQARRFAPEMIAALKRESLSTVLFDVAKEPTIPITRTGTDIARSHACDVVIGLGGGSVLDAAKAIAMLLANGGDPLDYLEVVGRGQPILKAPVPFIAIPTTAGTGAEVTRNAVLASPEHGVKASLRSPLMLPRAAIVDPELTIGLPPLVTASTGMDALTQLVEPFVCSRSNPLTDAICREGMLRSSRSLEKALSEGTDLQVREDLALASLFGGLALANSGLGFVHGFAAVIGGRLSAPHGTICAALLPKVFEVNARALTARDPGTPLLARFEEAARLLTGNPAATVAEGSQWLHRLRQTLEIPRLGALGVSPSLIPPLIEGAEQASSSKANPVRLTRAEMEEILLSECTP